MTVYNFSSLQLQDWLKTENFVSIKEIQKSPKMLLTGHKIITTNGKPCGVVISMEELTHLFEDIQALQSPGYLAKIQKSREEVEVGDIVDAETVKKSLL